ncbi:hypothetical protein BLA29_009182 [Euroglyphus maynei]|uniref:Uncharacterized protein n=1 Tax=Euroglyphus maynei TaxID=6958 RepID=A0A1Y3BXB3_EURMA|nr:hypothetical protein BLA29_009182 [Euroglyphus maynei]
MVNRSGKRRAPATDTANVDVDNSNEVIGRVVKGKNSKSTIVDNGDGEEQQTNPPQQKTKRSTRRTNQTTTSTNNNEDNGDDQIESHVTVKRKRTNRKETESAIASNTADIASTNTDVQATAKNVRFEIRRTKCRSY